jgi:hypothetical protein
MSEQTATAEESEAEMNPAPLDELTLLKKRADTIGIQYKSNIGVDSLKAKIEHQMNPPTQDEDVEDAPVTTNKRKTKIEIEQNIRDELHKTKMKLVRCRITNMNPTKADLEGEVVTVANRFLGTVRKFVPFGEKTDNGYHLPQVLFDSLRSRKFQQVKTKKVKGQIVHTTRMVAEFALEVLDPLTPEELKQLGDRQEASSRLEDGQD